MTEQAALANGTIPLDVYATRCELMSCNEPDEALARYVLPASGTHNAKEAGRMVLRDVRIIRAYREAAKTARSESAALQATEAALGYMQTVGNIRLRTVEYRKAHPWPERASTATTEAARLSRIEAALGFLAQTQGVEHEVGRILRAEQ